MTTARAQLLTTVAAATLVALLSGCDDQDPTGVTGTVTGRDQRHDPATKASSYHLSIDGTEYRVSYDTYSHCVRGSHYPTCKH